MKHHASGDPPVRRGRARTPLTAAAVLLAGGTANAAIVPTVPLATAAQYNVLAGSTVTNTGTSTILALSVGVHAGHLRDRLPGILDR